MTFYIEVEDIKLFNKVYSIYCEVEVNSFDTQEREILDFSIKMSELNIANHDHTDEIMFDEDNEIFHNFLVNELSYNGQFMDDLNDKFWEEYDSNREGAIADELYEQSRYEE
jgi:hypothetical protein